MISRRMNRNRSPFWGGSFFDEQFKFNEGFGLDYLTVGGCGSLAIW